jgi:hypothetical protein
VLLYLSAPASALEIRYFGPEGGPYGTPPDPVSYEPGEGVTVLVFVNPYMASSPENIRVGMHWSTLKPENEEIWESPRTYEMTYARTEEGLRVYQATLYPPGGKKVEYTVFAADIGYIPGGETMPIDQLKDAGGVVWGSGYGQNGVLYPASPFPLTLIGGVIAIIIVAIAVLLFKKRKPRIKIPAPPPPPSPAPSPAPTQPPT